MEARIRGMLLVVLSLSLAGCSGDDDGGGTIVPEVVVPSTEGPSDSPSVTDFFPTTQLDLVESLGLQLNLGDSPPNIEGTFRVDPRVLQATSVPDSAGEVGNTFITQDVTFSNQNAAAQTLDVLIEDDDVDQEDFGEIEVIGSSITGSENLFTALFISEITTEGQTFEIAQAFSGVATEAGIENIQSVEFVIDDGGDPGDFLFPSNTGSLFLDQDGFSERLEPGTNVPTSFDGSAASLINFYSESQIEEIESLGIQLNFGDDPPELNGLFRMDPAALEASTAVDESASIGEIFVPITFGFSGQNNNSLAINASIFADEGEDSIEIVSAFISGNDNAFTVFAVAELITPDGRVRETREIISGLVTEFGVQNLEWALLVLFDDEGTDSQSGRLFADSDGFSEIVEVEATTRIGGSSTLRSDFYTQ